MQKRTSDYDNVFKTMKLKHKRLFISVINDIFGKAYPPDTKVDVLPSEGYLTENATADGSKELEARISDFLIRIGNEVYLLECQSYDDGSMAIRLAEYAFIAAEQSAIWDIGCATIPMPRFSVIYVRRTDRTPDQTVITFIFPDGQTVKYRADNVILEKFTREYIVEKRLFPYIPFYITRYEKNIASDKSDEIRSALEDLAYFRDAMLYLHREKELSDAELTDLMGFVNTIITHITNGNKNEERLVEIMGGTVIETESERLTREGMRQGVSQGMREGQVKMIIELGREDGIDEVRILKRLQEKAGLSPEEARECLKLQAK